MNIGIVSSEAVPFSKTGGLADVAGTLFKILTSSEATTYLFTPYYKKTKEKFNNIEKRVPISVSIGEKTVSGFADVVEYYKNGFVIFIEQDEYFGRDELYGEKGNDYPDNALRFGFFSKAVLEAIKALDLKIDILHLNDWQSALTALLVKDKKLPFKTLYTIHNLGYQGNFDKKYLKELKIDEKYFNMDSIEFYGKISFMKAGIVYADKINTVSPTYAKEILTKEFGEGMEGILNVRKSDLIGILNGIDYDIWNPETDSNIYQNFSKTNIELKEVNKQKLSEEAGLNTKDFPLFGFVGRLASQKGVDILSESLKDFLKKDAAFIVLGTGEKPLEEKLRILSDLYPEKFKLFLTFDDKLAHKIYAGADFFVMPSRYEPCGLGQMIALRYGTLPVVHETGGLKDTIDNYSEITHCGNGISFDEYSADALYKAMEKSVDIFKDKDTFNKLRTVAMNCNFSWENSVNEYLKVYKELLDGD